MPNPTGTINADEDHSGKTITNVPDPSAAQDVATKAYADSVIGGGGGTWGSITGTLSAQTDLQTALNAKVDENAGITGATRTKITYDAKGLVTAGANATTADIADSTNKRYVTDANLTVIGNTSGTNTGDQVIPVISDVAYDATTWNGNTDGATKNAIRDKIESMGGGGTIASTTDILKGDNAGNAVALGSATSGKVLKSNGTTFVASTETYAAPGTTGNVLTSDGTNWTSAAPAVGGGVTSKVASSDFTTSSLTLVDITGLTFAAAATKLYEIDILLLVQSTTTAGNRYAVNYSAAGSEVTALAWGHQAVQSTAIISESWNSLNTTTSGYSTTANSYGVVRIRGFFRTGANTGNFTVKTAKVTSGTSTVYIGSRMTVTEL